MATSSAKIVLSLYKSMVRESQKFVDFNYRCYAIRRIKDSFKSNAQVTDQVLIDKKIDLAKQNLQLIQRQVTIGQLFGSKQQLSVEVPKDWVDINQRQKYNYLIGHVSYYLCGKNLIQMWDHNIICHVIIEPKVIIK